MAADILTLFAAQCHLLAFCPLGAREESLHQVLLVARVLSLGLERVDQNVIDTTTMKTLTQTIGAPMVGNERKVVLICGAFLEEQVSIAAQYLLGIGYSVYLLRDAIEARAPEHAHFHDLRLVQMGAIPTTLRQLTYEWTATETDPAIREILLQLPLS